MNKLLFLLPSLAWICSVIGTGLVLKLLTRAQVMDKPNERSNHKIPMPRGGGMAMIAVALVCGYFAGLPPRILLSGLLLACVSFVDDLRGLPASVRFLTQGIAVACALPALPLPILPDYIPPIAAYTALTLLWLWFINLTNFMDGIDGISALQTIAMMSGIILLNMLQHHFIMGYATQGFDPTTDYHALLFTILPNWLPVSAGILAASALGFLRFNFSPARLFMGDVGSIPLGFLSGYLLMSLAAYGYWAAALLLPAYYLADATLTLLLRASRGEKVWKAHSQHAYQKAVRSGMTHNQVVGRIALLNLLLVVLALLGSMSMMAGMIACIAGYAAAFILFYRLSHAPHRR